MKTYEFEKKSLLDKLKRFFGKRSVSERIVYTLVFIIFCAFAFSYLYMIFWCFISGMRTNDAVSSNAFGFDEFMPRNYIDVFSMLNVNEHNFLQMFLNSMYFCFLGPFLNITVTSMMSYVTAKYKFFGSKAVYFVVLVVITLPLYGTGTAMYKLLYRLKFLNSRMMIFTSLNGFSIYYMYFFAFWQGVSKSYAEAAEIDGANKWQIYFKIYLPQAAAMFGSLFLLLWITEWNSYATALIYLPKLPTLAVGIYSFKTSMTYESRMDILYAACFLSLIPPLVLFVCCNNALMNNVSLGGLKE